MIGLLRRRPALGYLFAVVAWVVAALARHLADPMLPAGFPYLTFFPAVILTAYVAGARPGILCAVLCGLTAWFYYFPPYYSFSVGPGTPLALGFYVFIVGIDIAIIHAMRVATERLVTERNVSAALAVQQKTMFSELQHRVANNLAFVTALLTLNRKRVEQDPAAAAEVMDEAVRRIELMGRIHRRLYRPEALEMDTGDYLRGLCDDLIEASGAKNIDCRVIAEQMRLDITRLTALSLIVTELMTNSFKHAFKGRERGAIHVGLKREGDRIALVIGDDGPGMPEDAPASGSLGVSIIQNLARQLDAELVLPKPGENATKLLFTAA